MALGALGGIRAEELIAEAVFSPDGAMREAALNAFRLLDAGVKGGGLGLDALPPPGADSGLSETLGMLIKRGSESGKDGPARVRLRPSLVLAARDALDGPVESVRAALTVLSGDHFQPATAGPGTEVEARPESVALSLEPRLAELSRHPDVTVRSRAVGLIASFNNDTAVDVVVAALDDPEPAVRRVALESLERWPTSGGERIVERVSRIVARHDDWSMRIRAISALGRMGGTATVDCLARALLGDSSAFVRSAAAQALGKVGAKTGFSALKRALSGDAEVQVRVEALRAIAKIGGSAEAMDTARGDSHPAVKEALKRLLEKGK
jgi:HEAT repeat protein